MKISTLLFFVASFILIVNAQPEKPVWPTQFDATFGLYVPANETAGQAGVVNAKSHFYYDYELQASVIDYPTNCIPLGFSGADQIPCRWYFNPKGSFLYFPQPVVKPNPFPQCCLLFPSVGTVPPNFLAGFNFSMATITLDYNNNPHYTNLWVGGGGGFQYWTDATTGDDVAFIDGGSVMWTFAPLNVQSQNPNIFDLPSSSCANSCEAELEVIGDPLFKLLMTFQ